MTNDYNILAEHIVQKYVSYISGTDITDKIVGEDPSERVMTGTLSENRIEKSLTGKYKENPATKFESVPSIIVSFILQKNIESRITVYPSGLLFYGVNPQYNEVVSYVIDKFSKKDGKNYTSINDIISEYPGEKIPFPLTHKVVRLEDVFNEGISLDINKEDITKPVHLHPQIKKELHALIEKISPDIAAIPKSKISLSSLRSEESFRIECPYDNNEINITPSWDFDIICDIAEKGDIWNISLQMVNISPVISKGIKNLGYIPKIFNAGLKILGNDNTKFLPIPLENLKTSFREKPEVYVVSENTSATFIIKDNEIITQNIPIFYQHRLKTNNDFDNELKFEKLIENPIPSLKSIYNSFKKDYLERIEESDKIKSSLTELEYKKFESALAEYKEEIERFSLGIKQIEEKEYVLKAFTCMNLTIHKELPGEQRHINGWRLFQIVFIVSLIPEVIRSEYKEEPDLDVTDVPTANLLYFPTGGGKTEAFLGISTFTMFFDRFRGKDDGVTAIIKYPLRLLAVQQLDRVLSVIVKANAIKKGIPEIKDKTDFRVGFYVGKANTPNKITTTEVLSQRGKKEIQRNLIVDAEVETLDENYRFIDTCPVCGKKEIHVFFNREKWVLEHRCTNPECNAGVLPLFIVDNEIYRYLPSIVVSTIDKMALLGTSADFKMLLGQVSYKCPVHGFSDTERCPIEGCSDRQLASTGILKDALPTLFIQDELHLVKESLGTFDSHYESFINNYALHLVHPSQRKQIRFIGATATISMYKEHIWHLYHRKGIRFPCEYPSVTAGRDFYSHIDFSDITRIILGYAPYGRSITNGVWESVYSMRRIIYRLFNNKDEYSLLLSKGFHGSFEDLQSMLYNYWIELVYNNVKQDAYDLQNALQNQGNNYLEAEGIPKFEIELMTSDTDFQAVRQTLFNIQANKENLNSTNLLLATSTISHGVDEDAFNIMYFYGMPFNNAEYVQAYSRSGRKYTGIVIDIIRLMRVRDRSYLKNFLLFHQNRDDLIESVPINRWAKNAVYSTLPGILVGTIYQYCTLSRHINKIYLAKTIKDLLNKGILDIEDIIEKVTMAYECNGDEKLSLAYQDIVRDEVSKILNGIKTSNFGSSEMLSSAIAKFSRGKHKPMTSLRDTEEMIEIEVRN